MLPFSSPRSLLACFDWSTPDLTIQTRFFFFRRGLPKRHISEKSVFWSPVQLSGPIVPETERTTFLLFLLCRVVQTLSHEGSRFWLRSFRICSVSGSLLSHTDITTSVHSQRACNSLFTNTFLHTISVVVHLLGRNVHFPTAFQRYDPVFASATHYLQCFVASELGS